MSKWLRAFQIAKVALKIADAHGVNIKGVPLGKIEGAIEKEVKAVKPKPRPVGSPGD